jgi:hypothetical protein
VALGIPAVRNSDAISSRPASRAASFTRSIVVLLLLRSSPHGASYRLELMAPPSVSRVF